jgi:CelD/BcsL family acetyltransferase involved in cellulose biosynthesis
MDGGEMADAAYTWRRDGEVAPAHSVNAVLPPLETLAPERWRELADHATEPNGYFLADWELAVNACASGRTGARALAAATPQGDRARLIGLLPVITARRAYGLPLPALVSADPYGTLGTPLLARDTAEAAAAGLMRQARDAGARALILRDMTLDGAAMAAFTAALSRDGLKPDVLRRHARAMLDATRDADALLREALGSKKLKELRRQRNRLADHGEVVFTIATAPDEIERAVETFLALETSGWKGRRGTALARDDGDAAFARRAVRDAAAQGHCEIVTLHAGATPVASAVVLRHLDRAFYFKLGVDERFARYSPGVQLTLELTRHLCADPAIATVDSTAAPGHPMIDPIWRDRLAIGDVLIPLKPRDPMVPVIRHALALRWQIRAPARHLLKFIRKIREGRP